MKKTVFKICSMILALAVLLASTVTGLITASAETSVDAILAAAKAYIDEKQNDVTASGLLAAVQAVDASVTLDTANDVFIKYAVPGVKDNDTASGYRLNIPGSNGAIAAVFGVGGARIGFAMGIKHEEELIDISEVAVVGTSSGFEYDSSNNVIAYTGTADKIIFPKGYFGTMTELSDKTSVNNVEVVVIDTNDPNNNYNTCVRMKENAFYGWNGLRAVQFGDNVHPRFLFDNVSGKYSSTQANIPNIFAYCSNLKYVKLPNETFSPNWSTAVPTGMFDHCSKLENVILPQKCADANQMGANAFAYTSVRDVYFPEWMETFTDAQSRSTYAGSWMRANGGRIVLYSDAMTFLRAAALVAAKAVEVSSSVSLDKTTAEAELLAAVTGSADADAFRATLSGGFNDSWIETEDGITATYTLSDGTDSVSVGIASASKNLKSLSVRGYELDKAFSPEVYEYSLTVPNGTSSVEILTEAEEGVEVTVSGNTELSVGVNTVSVVAKVEGEVIAQYSISVIVRNPDDVVEDVKSKASAYVQSQKNDLTPAGLLSELKASYPSIALNTDEDFFIKHSVPAVIDNDTESGYRLNIEGSSGAVAAVFVLNGERIAFVKAFGYETEVIDIKEVAVAGESEGFEYTDITVSGKTVKVVTNYTGNADKIVFPTDAPITMGAKAIQTAGAFDGVKVVYIDTDDTTSAGTALRLQKEAFSGWASLRAVQFGNNAHQRLLFDNISNQYSDGCIPYIFAENAELKYVKLPVLLGTATWLYPIPTGLFYNCAQLENVNIPPHDCTSNRPLAVNSFVGTAVRDFFLPQYVTAASTATSGATFDSGIRNIISYSDDMTFARAAALVAAKANDTEETVASVAEIKIISAISGAANAEELLAAMDVVFNLDETDTHLNGDIVLSYEGDSVSADYSVAKTAKGDTNEDGELDIIDLIRAKKNFAAGIHQSVKALDIDGDLIADAADMVLLAKSLLGSYTVVKDKAMYVNWKNEELKVVQKYSSTQDYVMVMRKLGGNAIFNIASPMVIDNTSSKVSSDIANARILNNLGESDWFGPHKVYAKANKDGDKPGAWTYTGGSHNFDNNPTPGTTGTTGRTANIVVKADGAAISSGYSDYADSLEVSWDNYIQAFNTMKADGTGREVLVEHITVKFDGVTWFTETEIEFLEQVGWLEYYGNQCIVNSLWNDRIKYGNDAWQAMNADTKASEAKCERMIINGDNHYLEMYLDSSYGLGDRSYLGKNEPSAFHKHYGNDKAYFNLVEGDFTMEAGTTVSYRGYYRFFSVG